MNSGTTKHLQRDHHGREIQHEHGVLEAELQPRERVGGHRAREQPNTMRRQREHQAS